MNVRHFKLINLLDDNGNVSIQRLPIILLVWLWAEYALVILPEQNSGILREFRTCALALAVSFLEALAIQVIF